MTAACKRLDDDMAGQMSNVSAVEKLGVTSRKGKSEVEKAKVRRVAYSQAAPR
jgi:hypothetical protein